MGCKEKELSVLLTEDVEIAELNLKYRHKSGPTDVLSFRPADADGGKYASNLLGDVVISLETAKRQGGGEWEEEILRLLIHGILHLLGYDHENVSAEEEKKMLVKESELFALTKPLIC